MNLMNAGSFGLYDSVSLEDSIEYGRYVDS
jgi:hypothetical protein